MNSITRFLTSIALALAVSVSAFAAGKVDINQDNASTLAAGLNGVGPAKAEAIVAHREKNGPFRSADQLAEVRGIGLATVEKNREVIVVSAAGSSAKTAEKPAQ